MKTVLLLRDYTKLFHEMLFLYIKSLGIWIQSTIKLICMVSEIFPMNIYLINEECFEQQNGWHITLVQYAYFIFPMGF